MAPPKASGWAVAPLAPFLPQSDASFCQDLRKSCALGSKAGTYAVPSRREAAWPESYGAKSPKFRRTSQSSRISQMPRRWPRVEHPAPKTLLSHRRQGARADAYRSRWIRGAGISADFGSNRSHQGSEDASQTHGPSSLQNSI